ncbi:MAG: pyridoxamine 5'-phosphate oxidase family protein [Chloroflexi bacterium]|nr:pyridoxamine 5'-phosphate oxidase family protein [Chloroflexota bacterium]
MPTPEITPQAQEFLSRRLIGRLATASAEGQPHVIPVWFLWENNAIWISSYRSTRKIIDLESNSKCALVVDVDDAQGGLTAVMLEGRAELVSTPESAVKERIERVYTKYLGPQGLLEKDPQTWLNSPENVLIKLTPTRVKAW